MHHLVCEHTFEFCWLEPLNELRVVNDAPAVRRHCGQLARQEFEADSERAEERVIQQKLGTRANQALLRCEIPVHAATDRMGTWYPAM